MSAAAKLDARFPNLRPEVVEGYASAPASAVAEVIDGELSLMPRPRPRHAHVSVRLSGRLRGYSDPADGDPGGWVIFVEPELHLGRMPDIVVPDVAGWHRERFPAGALEDDAPAAISIAPDWCCEVLSPRTAAYDRGEKRRTYAREAVHHLWLVDPAAQTLEVFRLEGAHYTLLDTWEGDAVVAAEPFEATSLPLAALWRL